MIDIIGWLALICLWVITLFIYSDVPDTIPTHYDAAGEVDDYGSKNMLFLLPIVASVLFITLTVLNRLPHLFNLPVKITDENAIQQYTFVTRLLRYLKLVIVVILGAIVIRTWQVVSGADGGLGGWFLPFTVMLLSGPIFYYLTKALRHKPST